jgi:hypothetical protein
MGKACYGIPRARGTPLGPGSPQGALLVASRARVKSLSLGLASIAGMAIVSFALALLPLAAAGGAAARARELSAAHEGYCSKAPMWGSPCSRP